MISPDFKNTLRNKLGIDISSLLLPAEGIDMKKWAVVACDQYTSQPEYWKEIDDFVGNSPSALRLIFPEVYLECEDENHKSSRIADINKTMESYLESGLFTELTDTVILLERTFENGKTRHGLIFAVDLEHYDYSKGSQSLIRSTEGTIIDRLPPRIRVREKARLELPHIMLLIDDKDRKVIEPLVEKSGSLPEVYSFELMKRSGSVKGWKISHEKDLKGMAEALLSLADIENFRSRYRVGDEYGLLLFAVGDGNHSLATAKACWEKIKNNLSGRQLIDHPARYALVEVVNIHDEGLVFEPIHRVLFNVNTEHLIETFCKYYQNKGCKAYMVPGRDRPSSSGQIIEFVTSGGSGFLVAENPAYSIDVGTLQTFLDDYLKSNTKTSIDYVHGEDVALRLGSQPGNMGFFLAPMDKNELFRTVILDGALPRKTFSMGEASEKRFYLEARRIR